MITHETGNHSWQYANESNIKSCKLKYNLNFKQIVDLKARSLVVSDLRSGAKVPGSSPAATYVQRWALCSNRSAYF